MADPIYTGWGNRTRIKSAIKQSFLNADIQRQASKFSPTYDGLRAN